LNEFRDSSRAVEAYTLSTNSWSARKPLPNARFESNGASVINGRLYVTGGCSGSFFSTCSPTKTLYVYNPATNAWSRKADMPRESMAPLAL